MSDLDKGAYRPRLIWPGEDENDYLVLDHQANIVGRIYREAATSQDRWLFFVEPGNLPRRADLYGYVDTSTRRRPASRSYGIGIASGLRNA